MTDVEFTKILQRVVAVIGQTPRAESYPPGFQTVDGLELPDVANDNDQKWPFIPLPDNENTPA